MKLLLALLILILPSCVTKARYKRDLKAKAETIRNIYEEDIRYLERELGRCEQAELKP